MNAPPQQPTGITENEEEEKQGPREPLKDGDASRKDNNVSYAETSSSGKDAQLQGEAGKTTSGPGTGGTKEVIFGANALWWSGDSQESRQFPFDKEKMFL